MEDLIAFIRRCLDDEEQAARRVPDGYRLYACDDGHVEQPSGQWADGDDRLPNHHNSWSLVYDRAERLADIAAKRRIMDWCERVARIVDEVEVWSIDVDDVLSALAQPYADREGFREEWRAS